MNKHNPEDEKCAIEADYLVRYHGCRRILEAYGIKTELSSLRRVFPLLCKDKEKTGLSNEALQAIYKEALQNLFSYIAHYGKPVDYSQMSKAELDAAFMDECYVNNPDVAKLQQMLDLGADMYQRDSSVDMPCYARAMGAGGIELMRLFLGRGGDVNYRYPHYPNDTPDYYNTFWLNHIVNATLPQIELMLQHGAKVLDIDSSGNNALHLVAGSRANLAVVKLFTQKGVPVNAQNKDSETPLLLLSRNELNAECCLHLLLRCGANPNLTDKYGTAPIHRTGYWWEDKHAVIECLSECGADLDKLTNESKTALHIAVERNRPPLINLLLQAGADAQIRDKQGRTPYELAIALGFVEAANCFNNNASADYQNRPEYAQIQAFKAQIIAALKNGRRRSRGDKEGWQEFYYAGGEYVLESADHYSDQTYRSTMNEEEALKYIYNSLGYYDKLDKTEVQMWETAAKMLS